MEPSWAEAWEAIVQDARIVYQEDVSSNPSEDSSMAGEGEANRGRLILSERLAERLSAASRRCGHPATPPGGRTTPHRRAHCRGRWGTAVWRRVPQCTLSLLSRGDSAPLPPRPPCLARVAHDARERIHACQQPRYRPASQGERPEHAVHGPRSSGEESTANEAVEKGEPRRAAQLAQVERHATATAASGVWDCCLGWRHDNSASGCVTGCEQRGQRGRLDRRALKTDLEEGTIWEEGLAPRLTRVAQRTARERAAPITRLVEHLRARACRLARASQPLQIVRPNGVARSQTLETHQALDSEALAQLRLQLRWERAEGRVAVE